MNRLDAFKARVAEPKSVWLIERGQAVMHSPTVWWVGGNEWSQDANLAIKFWSPSTATGVAERLMSPGSWTVTAHRFIDEDIERLVAVVTEARDKHDEECGCNGEACRIGDALAYWLEEQG